MKKKAIIIRTVVLILASILLMLELDYARINIRYFLTRKEYEDSFKIQGTKDGYAPQGMTYIKEKDIVLQTAYSKGKASKLFVIDFKTGKLKKELKLVLTDGAESKKHVGGIASDGKTVWITNDFEISAFKLSDILKAKDEIRSIKDDKIPSRGDFCYYKDNTLWIGDFFLKPFYPIANDDPLLYAYDVYYNIDYKNPKLVISLPIMVQGMAIEEHNEFIFTSSFTNLVNSELLLYENVLEEEPDYYEINGIKVPHYSFNKNNLSKSRKIPPMAEGIFYDNGYVYILFESNSSKYFYAEPKIRNVLKYKLRK